MTVVLVRHAERHPSGSDAISDVGKRRAALLAQMFGKAGVTAIFTSGFTRTKQTAKPLAQATGIAPRVIASDFQAASVQIRAAGSLVVVVGHSDTVPELVAALGGPGDLEIPELEFDRMFIVSGDPGSVSTLTFRYVSV